MTRLLLSGEASSVRQAEELVLDTHLAEILRLLESNLSEQAFREPR